jgi:hypothetical protein
VRDQAPFDEGLFEKVDGSRLHCVNRHRHIALAGEKDDRKLGSILLEPLQKLESAHTGETYFRDETRRPPVLEGAQELLGAGIEEDVDVKGAKERLHARSDAGVSVDDEYPCPHRSLSLNLSLRFCHEPVTTIDSSAGIVPLFNDIIREPECFGK